MASDKGGRLVRRLETEREMTGQKIVLKGWRIDKSGALVKDQRRLDVSARLRMKGSKKVRVKKHKGIGFL